MRNVLVVVFCLLANTLLSAQKTVDPRERQAGFILEAGEHELTDIIEKTAKFLGRNYLFSGAEQAVAQARGGRRGAAAPVVSDLGIQLQKRLILDAVACEEVVSQLAYSLGYLIVPVDALRGIHEVISVNGPRARTLLSRFQYLTPEEVLRKSRMRIIVATVVPLTHIPALRASQSLRPFFSSSNGLGTLSIGSSGTDSSLLLKGFAQNVAVAIGMLETMDKVEKAANPTANQTGQIAYLQKQHLHQQGRVRALESRIAQLELVLGKQQLTERKATLTKSSTSEKRPVRRRN